MTGILFALLCAASWGTADYLAGTQAKKLPTLLVATIGQCAGLLVVVPVIIVFQLHTNFHAAAWALAAGVSGTICLSFLYRGLATGSMSVVAPISACGALVPVVVTFLRGEIPPLSVTLGIPIALVGAVLVAAERSKENSAKSNSRAVFYALGAALFIGGFFTLMQTASRSGNSDELALLGVARFSSSLLFVATFLRPAAPAKIAAQTLWRDWKQPDDHTKRSSAKKAFFLSVGSGLFDLSATTLFLLASGRTNPAVAAVLGSLYPLMTVALAHLLLKERLELHQRFGVGVAMLGVALLASG